MNSTAQVQGINPDLSTIPDEIHHLGSSINRVVNSHEELSRSSCQTGNPRQGIAVPLLMLLSQIRLVDNPVVAPGRPTISGNEMKYSVSENLEQSDNDSNLLSAFWDSIPKTLSRAGEFMLQYDPLRFPEASALPTGGYQDKEKSVYINRFPRHVFSKQKTTTPSFVPDDVKQQSLDFSCVEKRQSLSISDVFRQIGKTLSNPVSEFANEYQVINFYNYYHRCPTQEEMKNLLSITSVVDKTISIITELLPSSKRLVVTQRVGGPLFRMIADSMDNKQLNVDDLSELNNQLLTLAKSIVGTSLRDLKGNAIESLLGVPNGLSFKKNKMLVNINGRNREIIIENGEFFTIVNGNPRRISYVPETKKWSKVITNKKTNRIVKSFGSNVYFDHYITNKLSGAIDKKNLYSIIQNRHGIYTVTSKQSGKSFNVIKIGDEFYHYIPENEKNESLSGVIKTYNSDVKVSRFEKRYFIVNEKRKLSVKYSPCRSGRSPGALCLHFSDGLIKKLHASKKNGIPANKIQGLNPSETQPGLYESAKGRFYLKYDDVYFKLTGGFDKKVDSKFMVTGKKTFGSKQITPVCFSREKGNSYINTPEENMMESAGVSREMAISHIEMHTDFTPVDLKRVWSESMHGPFNLDKRFTANRWITNKNAIMVYRQDNRSLDEIIAAGGFYPQKETLGTIEDHMTGSRDQYSYVSTSIKRLKSGSYGKYEYAIYLTPGQGIDTAATLAVSHSIPSASVEFAVPGIITPGQIKGWRKCN
ncbi:MAG: scabin-related ADP-ribosyltransferase [Plesiomonas sp.]|uniref:scabin-related ADP-ribosyltransferase n=1 Tax=Plesiomonas sp. TaxID=2486279 RepID=UPI003F2A8DED